VTARAAANVVDWRDVAYLVQKGCPPELALDIARVNLRAALRAQERTFSSGDSGFEQRLS